MHIGIIKSSLTDEHHTSFSGYSYCPLGVQAQAIISRQGQGLHRQQNYNDFPAPKDRSPKLSFGNSALSSLLIAGGGVGVGGEEGKLIKTRNRAIWHIKYFKSNLIYFRFKKFLLSLNTVGDILVPKPGTGNH